MIRTSDIRIWTWNECSKGLHRNCLIICSRIPMLAGSWSQASCRHRPPLKKTHNACSMHACMCARSCEPWVWYLGCSSVAFMRHKFHWRPHLLLQRCMAPPEVEHEKRPARYDLPPVRKSLTTSTSHCASPSSSGARRASCASSPPSLRIAPSPPLLRAFHGFYQPVPVSLRPSRPSTPSPWLSQLRVLASPLSVSPTTSGLREA